MKLDYKEKIIDLFKKEQKKEWYKKINPEMKVPAIKDGEHWMGESLDICRYLIETRKVNTPLYPVDDKEKIAQIEKDLKLCQEQIDVTTPAVRKCYFAKAFGMKMATVAERKAYLDAVYKVYGKMEAVLAERKTKFFNSDGKLYSHWLFRSR